MSRVQTGRLGVKSVDGFRTSLKKLDISSLSRVTWWRIPVGLILEYLAAEKSADEMIAEYPHRTRDRIAAGLDYAHELADFEAAV